MKLEIKKNEKGSVAILVMFMMTILLASAGAAIDVGVVIMERTKLSNALDYAALAGAQELPDGKAQAVTVANAYLNDNGIDPSTVEIQVSDDGKSLSLVGTKEVGYTFLKVLGLDQTSVAANSKVILGTAGKVKGGLRPYAVEDFDYQYGELITLKEGAGSSYNGNFGVVALGGTGSSIYETNALHGYKGEIAAGDDINTEPGNMSNVSNLLKTYINSIPHTFESHPRDSDRLWTVPLVDSLDESGRGYVTVTGFAQVFVEDIDKNSGKIEINARFVRFVVNGDIDTTLVDRGTYGVKLVN